MNDRSPHESFVSSLSHTAQHDLLHAAKALFAGVYTIDLSANTYTAIKQADGLHAPRHGAYGTLFSALLGVAHPEDRERFRVLFDSANLKKKLSGGKHVMQMVRAARSSGSYHWLSIEAVCMRVTDGRGDHAALFVRSIDQQKRQSERDTTLRALLGHPAPDHYEHIATIDAHSGAYTLHSNNCAQMADLPKTGDYDHVIRLVEATHVPDDSRQAFAAQMRLPMILSRLTNTERFTYRFPLCNNEVQRWYEAAFCFLDSSKHEVLLTITDVHAHWQREQEQKQAEERQKQILTEALAIARREGGVKRSFLAHISQTLLDPLNVIIGMARMAGAALDDSAQVRHYLDEVVTASHALHTLVADLIDIARTEDAAVPQVANRFPLRSIEEDVAFVTELARRKGISIEGDLSGLPDIYVTGDRDALSKILRNIGESAVEDTPPGGTVRLSAKQQYRNGNMLVARFIIEDYGPGMSAQQLQHLFEPFQSGNGASLGMAITKRYADTIGATIDAQSKQGKGTTITVDVPLEAAPNDLPHPSGQDIVASESIALAGCRVLLAEDSELNAEIAIALLGLHGVIVDHAINGEDAIARYNAHPPYYYDAVLMDIQMPVLGGLDATRAIRGCGREDCLSLPIIAMSANAFQEDLTHALQSSMNDYITKPFELERLLASLRVHIVQRRAQRD